MSEESGSEPPAVGAWLRDRYHRLALAAIVAFMLWNRLTPYDSFVRDSGVFFSGNDAFYHFREVSYTVRHWPSTMPFDPWTQFPYGTSQGQFGTLWDQVIATAALIIGLGSPTDRLVAEVTVAAPAVAGALLALPVYGIASRVADRRAGIVAAILLALFPGTVLRRSLAGFSDHHVAEMVLQAAAIFATVVALQVAERERPVIEQVLERDWAGVRTPAIWSLVAGLAIVTYIWTWPPGVVLVGILGVFYAVAASVEFVREGTAQHVAFVGAVSLGVTALLLFLSSPSIDTSTTQLSMLQVLLAALVAVECVGLGAVERTWGRFGLKRVHYPIIVACAALGGTVALFFLAPEVFNRIQTSSLRAFGLTHTDQSRTIAEAQSPPLDSLGGYFQRQYGFAYLAAAAGIVTLSWEAVTRDSGRPQRVLLVVWTVFVVMMALTQRRFNYYLAASVAVLSGILVAQVIEWIDFPAYEELADVEVYQVLSIAVLAMLLVFPLTPVMSPQPGTTVFNGAANSGPGSVTTWSDGLEWMDTSTPSPEGDGFEYYGTYEKTADFDYPAFSYGVMSWWDYGHWITVIGERIPVANPFQQNPRPASAFFQATTERRANAITDALPATSDVDDRTTDELEAIAANRTQQQSGENVRYVMIDDQMAGGKFTAITRWAGPGTQEYFERKQYRLGDQNRTLTGTSKRYDESMLAQLYYEDATELSHYRLVHEVNRYAIISGYVQARTGRQRFAQRPLGSYPLRGEWNRSGEGAPRNLSRTVQRAQGRAINFGPGTYLYNAEVESRVKTFERVRGATITGEADPNTTVQAILPLTVTNTGRQFTALRSTTADAQGEFNITVPYPSEAGLGPTDGGTNETVKATGKWQVFTGSLFSPQTHGNATITEQQVLDGGAVRVELSPVESGDGTSGNETTGNGTTTPTSGSDAADGSGTDGAETTPTPTPTAANTTDASG